MCNICITNQAPAPSSTTNKIVHLIQGHGFLKPKQDIFVHLAGYYVLNLISLLHVYAL